MARSTVLMSSAAQSPGYSALQKPEAPMCET